MRADSSGNLNWHINSGYHQFYGSVSTSLPILYLANNGISQTPNATFFGPFGTAITGGGSAMVAIGQQAGLPTSAPSNAILLWANTGSPGSLGLFTTGVQFHRLAGNIVLSQDTPTSDVAPTNINIIGQAAFATASTNKTGGAVYIQGGAGAAGGTTGPVYLQTFGATYAFISGATNGNGFGIGSTPGTDPTITRGTGVPATTQPNGSLFLRTDGTDGTNGLYVRESGVWNVFTGTGVTWANDLVGSTNTTQTVVGLRSKALPALPGSDQYLHYTGSAWAFSTISGSVAWANDLAGSTGSNQWIAAISGNAGGGSAVPLNTTSLLFAKGQGTPAYGQSGQTTDVATTFLTLRAQDAWTGASTNVNGGALFINGGESKSAGVTGRRGDVQLGIGFLSFAPGVQVTEPVVGQRVLALVPFAGSITSTQMPTNSGDGVIYIANVVTAPTANPVSGGTLFENAGTLSHRGPGGATEQFAGAGTGTVNTQLGNHKRVPAFVRTTSATTTTIYTYAMPATGHTTTFKVVATVTDTTSLSTSLSCEEATMFINSSGTITQNGSTQILWQTSGSGAPIIFTISGTNILVQVVPGNTGTNDWTIWLDIYEN